MTPQQQAQAELAKRELARREIARRQSVSQQQAQPSFSQSIKQGIASTIPSALPPGISTAVDTAFNKTEALPSAGQAIGGTFGGMKGAVGGAMVGQAGKQAIDYLKGGDKPDVGAVGKEGLVTGLVEGLTRGTGKVFFRKQIANEALQGLSKKLGAMKKALSDNPQIKSASKPILDSLKTAYNDLEAPLQTGKTAKVLRTWIAHLEKNPNLPAKTLIRLEEQLGKAAEYGEYKKGVFQAATDIANPQANKIARAGRTQVSDIVDDLAEKSGQKGFGKTSKELSKMIAKFPEFDPTKQYGGFGQRLVTSSMAGMATGNPLIGAGAYVAQRTLQSPEVRNALFNFTKNKAAQVAGKGAKLTLSELARRAK